MSSHPSSHLPPDTPEPLALHSEIPGTAPGHSPSFAGQAGSIWAGCVEPHCLCPSLHPSQGYFNCHMIWLFCCCCCCWVFLFSHSQNYDYDHVGFWVFSPALSFVTPLQWRGLGVSVILNWFWQTLSTVPLVITAGTNAFQPERWV